MLATRIGIETINLVVAQFVSAFDPAGPVLDVGSYYTQEYAELCDRRSLFPSRPYVGCDIRPGPGVDRIERVEHLSFPDESFGAVLLLETLEHVAQPERALSEVRRVLAPNGLLLISVPFNYRLHGFPTDYWRFTASGLHTRLEQFDQRCVFAIGPRVMPSTVFAVAAKHAEHFAEREGVLHAQLELAMRSHRRRHALKVIEERSRDLLGLLFGRAQIEVAFFGPDAGGGYARQAASASNGSTSPSGPELHH